MSKDNTVIIVPCVNGNFYVRNVQASEDLLYDADVVPVGETEPYYNLTTIYDYFIHDCVIYAEDFMKKPLHMLVQQLLQKTRTMQLK